MTDTERRHVLTLCQLTLRLISNILIMCGVSDANDFVQESLYSIEHEINRLDR